MKIKICLILTILSTQLVTISVAQTSPLDGYVGILRYFRKMLNLQQEKSLKEPFNTNVRIQKQTPISVKFPCPTANSRSETIPTSVHTLKPGDIDVIGAIGDSLTAGFAVTAKSLNTAFSDTRGMTFPIGGDLSWREIVTIPNILKVFNPQLFGYSKGVSLTIERNSQFNVAEDAAVSYNIPYMTKVLTKRILNDPRVNITRDWKMITIFIGSNDFCSEICYFKNMELAVLNHKRDLLASLRLLKKYLPRTFVNIIVTPDVSLLGKFTSKPPMCEVTQRLSCPCFIGEQMRDKRSKTKEVMAKFRKLQFDISTEEEFDKDDFTIVTQPLLLNTQLPVLENGQTDITFFGIDCFHFSQKAHSLLAKALWINILEPVGGKTDNFTLEGTVDVPIVCPDEQYPYLFTNRNSKDLHSNTKRFTIL